MRLPPTERRRAGTAVKAAVGVADAAVLAADVDPSHLPTVFTSSSGDPANCHALCEALAAPQRMVSPTRFTNSVHNAAAGYWHIATASHQPSTSLAGHDASFAIGLLEAAVQCHATQGRVLLVACDTPYPEPLNAVRPIADVFAVAMVLGPPGAGRGLRVIGLGDQPFDRCADAALEAVRCAIPAARSLPLLQSLASPDAADVVLECLPGQSLRLILEAAR
jgi:hypothetical protein